MFLSGNIENSLQPNSRNSTELSPIQARQKKRVTKIKTLILHLNFSKMNILETKTSLETYFEPFRNNIIGIDQEFASPFKKKKIIYADWTASGRLYRPIEEKIMNDFGPFVANTHTETTVTGTAMTLAYHKAREVIKKHVNASEDDVFIAAGTGMTGVRSEERR